MTAFSPRSIAARMTSRIASSQGWRSASFNGSRGAIFRCSPENENHLLRKLPAKLAGEEFPTVLLPEPVTPISTMIMSLSQVNFPGLASRNYDQLVSRWRTLRRAKNSSNADAPKV